jgi:predicted RNase H-like HicB family nuclease
LKYLIVIEKADGNYCAYSPDIPGCVAAAIQFHLEGLQEDSLPIPLPSARAEWVVA